MFEINPTQLSVFFAAAILLAFTPGPGIAYVVARTASGGKEDGIASSFGTAVGGLVHVAAAALGLSILISESAILFSILKYAGAGYLMYLGLRMMLLKSEAKTPVIVKPVSRSRVFWDGVVVEVFNVKTALFFLAFIPQFVNPAYPLASQFIFLGTLCVVMNAMADVLAVIGSTYLIKRTAAAHFLNLSSGAILIGLGAYLVVFDRER